MKCIEKYSFAFQCERENCDLMNLKTIHKSNCNYARFIVRAITDLLRSLVEIHQPEADPN